MLRARRPSSTGLAPGLIVIGRVLEPVVFLVLISKALSIPVYEAWITLLTLTALLAQVGHGTELYFGNLAFRYRREDLPVRRLLLAMMRVQAAAAVAFALLGALVLAHPQTIGPLLDGLRLDVLPAQTLLGLFLLSSALMVLRAPLNGLFRLYDAFGRGQMWTALTAGMRSLLVAVVTLRTGDIVAITAVFPATTFLFGLLLPAADLLRLGRRRQGGRSTAPAPGVDVREFTHSVLFGLVVNLVVHLPLLVIRGVVPDDGAVYRFQIARVFAGLLRQLFNLSSSATAARAAALDPRVPDGYRHLHRTFVETSAVYVALTALFAPMAFVLGDLAPVRALVAWPENTGLAVLALLAALYPNLFGILGSSLLGYRGEVKRLGAFGAAQTLTFLAGGILLGQLYGFWGVIAALALAELLAFTLPVLVDLHRLGLAPARVGSATLAGGLVLAAAGYGLLALLAPLLAADAPIAAQFAGLAIYGLASLAGIAGFRALALRTLPPGARIG